MPVPCSPQLHVMGPGQVLPREEEAGSGWDEEGGAREAGPPRVLAVLRRGDSCGEAVLLVRRGGRLGPILHRY